MTATLDRVLAAADAGVMADGKPADPDPEVPERARRRAFTEKYKKAGCPDPLPPPAQQP